jgi:hypothetical protein
MVPVILKKLIRTDLNDQTTNNSYTRRFKFLDFHPDTVYFAITKHHGAHLIRN